MPTSHAEVYGSSQQKKQSAPPNPATCGWVTCASHGMPGVRYVPPADTPMTMTA